ncbi:MAG TPA: hypothetical protein DHW63_10060 [Hyphomonadaceae bacterium]|nr:hypothetical protein [Hyphomonadaceae bacterium]
MLGSCKQCDGVVSEKAVHCPHCGVQQPFQAIRLAPGGNGNESTSDPMLGAADKSGHSESAPQSPSDAAWAAGLYASEVRPSPPWPVIMFSFRGRLNRLGYLAYLLGPYVVFLGLVLLFAYGYLLESGGTVLLILFVLQIPIGLAAAVRRFHDMDHSGWMLAALLVPFWNIWLAIQLLVWPGTPGYNQYGAPPPAAPNRSRFRLPVIIAAAAALLIVGFGVSRLFPTQSPEGALNAAQSADKNGLPSYDEFGNIVTDEAASQQRGFVQENYHELIIPGELGAGGCTADDPSGVPSRTAIEFYNCGAVRLGRGEHGRAIADFTEAIRLEPRAEAFAFRGVAYYDQGDHARAIADYNEAIRLDPRLALAFNNRGLAHYDQGNLARAIADYNEAVRLDPRLALAFNNRGFAYLGQGAYPRATADFDEAIRLDPRLALAFNNRGLTYHGQGNHARAIADYNEAIRLNPGLALIFNNRGRTYEELGDRVHAIADFTEAIRLNPRIALVYSNRGAAHYAQGDYVRAIADYDEAIRLDPRLAAAFNNRGLAHNEQGDLVRAIADYTEAIRLDPSLAVAFANRGDAYSAQGDRARAEADYREAARLDPGQSEAAAPQQFPVYDDAGHLLEPGYEYFDDQGNPVVPRN